tara:strand:- start:5924 stop:6145 length:222 start_codon:yes stop_codon:yes gene_type:complete
MIKEDSKDFYIIEARDSKTNQIEKKRIYTTLKQYESIGLKQVHKFKKYYNVKVTRYICNESICILDNKQNQDV